MPIKDQLHTYYCFHDFKLCLKIRELTFNQQPVLIESKVFDCLSYLIQHRDRAVSKQELHRELWNERPMSESVMARNIMKARKAVNDDGKKQLIIKTIPSYGYRFVAPTNEYQQVHQVVPGETNTADQPTRFNVVQKSSYHRISWLITVVLAATLVLSLTMEFSRTDLAVSSGKAAFVVLPIRNSTGDQEYNWVTLGLMTMINQALSARPQIEIVDSEDKFVNLTTTVLPTDSYLGIMANVRRRLSLSEAFIFFAELHSDRGALRLRYWIQTPTGETVGDQLVDHDLSSIIRVIGERISERLNINNKIPILHQPHTSKQPLAGCYWQAGAADIRGAVEKAKSIYRHCLELTPESMWAVYQLALLEAKSGEWQKSDALAQQLFKRSHEDSDQYYAIAANHVLGEKHLRKGNLSDAERYFRTAIDLADSNARNLLSATLTVGLATVYRLQGDLQQSVVQLQRIQGVQQRHSDQIGEASTLQEFGRLSFSQGDLRAAQSYTREALDIRRAHNHYAAEADSLNEMGRIFMVKGQWDRAELYFTESLKSCRLAKNWWQQVQVLMNLAELKQKQGNLQDSFNLLQQASELSGQADNAMLLLAVRSQQLIMQSYVNFSDSVLEQLTGLRDQLSDLASATRAGAELNLRIGRMYLIQHALADADLVARLALSATKKINNTFLEVRALRLLANIAHMQNQIPLAGKLYREASVLAESLGYGQLLADIKVDLGYLCMQIQAMDDTEALLLSLSHLNNYYRVVALQARYKYHMGEYLSAVQLYSQAKKLAGDMWTEREQKLLERYQAAAAQGETLSVDLFAVSFSV